MQPCRLRGRTPRGERRQVARRLGSAAAAASLLVSAPVHAVSNLESGLPVEIEDAEPAETGRMQLQAPLLQDRERNGSDRLTLEPRFQWGFAPRWQASLSVPVVVGSGDRTNSGDVRAELMHQFNQEGRLLPALAVFMRLDLPSGRDSRGVDPSVRLAATKTLGERAQTHQVHANVMWLRNAAAQPQERPERGRLLLGYSTPVAARSVFVADWIREQSRERAQRASIAEVGLIHELARETTLAFGVGTGRGAGAPRWRIVAGVQQAF